MANKLVIVESPAKARTLARFLGPGYRVEASIGHVRDLPESAREIPAQVKKLPWARLGVDVDNGFQPLYVVPEGKKEQIKKLKALLAEADTLYLATDEDREGESISWHLKEVLKPRVPTKRLVFHEITRDAVLDALRALRDIDIALVRAQEARRIVDRLYGYIVSPLLWKKVRPRLSAGRVQSVAVRLIVERERARIAFRAAGYWDVAGTFAKEGSPPFPATLVRVGGRRVANGRDFDPSTGRLSDPSPEGPVLLAEADARALAERLAGQRALVGAVEEKPFTQRPAPPYTTSTLQQDGNRKLRLSARRTMELAQRLYENGVITYMRTDSTTLSDEALRGARAFIEDRFGADYLPAEPRLYKSKVKNAQEAHEAIRPAGSTFASVAEVEAAHGADAARLYDLILKRTVASQMPDARGRRTSVEIGVGEASFQASGKVIEFPGFLRAYVASSDRDTDEDAEVRLPALATGEALRVVSLEPTGHTTQAPPRLTEASLVKELEAAGIGRPSTYASIIETILRREYVRKQGTALVPTFTAFAVVNLMERFLGYLVDYGFTAAMEDELDAISLGDLDMTDYLARFYRGNGQPGLRAKLEEVEATIDPRDVCSIPLGQSDGQTVEVRIGRYGPFLSCGDVRSSLPDDLAPDELTLEKALALLEKARQGPRVLGQDPATGKSVYAKEGRFGPYVQLGEASDEAKPKMASLLAGMALETLKLDEALALLSLPRKLGEGPGGEDVLAANGRYGPYVQCGKETRSLPPDQSPLVVELAQALDLLARPKERRGRRARREPLKELGPHPESKAPVRVLDGRFGPYVTDGTVNASLPRGTALDEVSLDFAVELLAERARQVAERGGSAGRPRGGRRTAGAKKAPAKKGGPSRRKRVEQPR